MPEMKPCPFCGGKGKLVENLYYDAPDIIGGGRNKDFDSFYVKCESCHMVPNSYGNDDWPTRESAITAWNTRADGWVACSDELPERTKHDYYGRRYSVPCIIGNQVTGQILTEVAIYDFICEGWLPYHMDDGPDASDYEMMHVTHFIQFDSLPPLPEVKP